MPGIPSPSTSLPPLHIAFASIHRVKDVRLWSGTVTYMARALEQSGLDVDYIDELDQVHLLVHKAMNRLWRMTGQRGAVLPVERSMHMAKRFARGIARFVAEGKHDLVFSPSSIPVALLKDGPPAVFYTDATFAELVRQQPSIAAQPADLLQEGHDLEHAALENCAMAIYASEWAARSAIEHYGAAPSKLRVLPFGSNLDVVPEEDEVRRAISHRPTDRCELLFLAARWEFKGGEFALEVARELNRSGIPTRLRIVGCIPPSGTDTDLVEVIPFVDKSTAEGHERLARLILSSHFLLLPSLVECFGIVYTEASSMGVPSLARLVDGVGSAVRHGRNGYTFHPDVPPAVYAEKIAELMGDRQAYERLAMSSFHEHRANLNWDVVGGKLVDLLRTLAP